MSSVNRSPLRAFWRKYADEIPRIASSLTTAAILFAIAVVFRPAIQRLFTPPAQTYPISCSADPVSVDLSTSQSKSAFFIVNRGDEEFDSGELAEQLAGATGNEITPANTVITLRYGGYNGRFLRAQPDAEFNGDKGELDVTFTDNTIHIAIKRIAAAAVLKVDVEAILSPAPPILSRSMKAALPFENQNYEQVCYRG